VCIFLPLYPLYIFIFKEELKRAKAQNTYEIQEKEHSLLKLKHLTLVLGILVIFSFFILLGEFLILCCFYKCGKGFDISNGDLTMMNRIDFDGNLTEGMHDQVREEEEGRRSQETRIDGEDATVDEMLAKDGVTLMVGEGI
jgi:hypothetical protein